MADLLGVSVEELVAILRRKKARVPFEIGAFVALEACEAMMAGPARISPTDVRIADDGTVSVFAPPNSASNADAAQSVVRVLAHLLVAAGPGVPPVLLELVERGPSDGRWDLSRLRDELEASLVPLNRQAARRVLSRMLREAARDGAVRKSSLPPAPREDDIDAALDALVGGGEVPKAPAMPRVEAPAPAYAHAGAAGPVPAQREPRRTPFYAPTPEPVAAPVVPSASRGDAIWDTPPAGPPARKRREDDSLAETLEPGIRAATVTADEYDFEDQATFVKDRSEPPPPMGAPARIGPPDDGLDILDELAAELPPEHALLAPAAPQAIESPPLAPREPTPETLPSERFEPRPARRRGEVDLSDLEEVTQPKRSRSLLWALLFLVLSGLLLVGVAVLRPDAVDWFMGREAPEDIAARQLAEERRAEQARLLEEHASLFGTLTVDVDQERAQVLLFVGRGPAVAEYMPVGVANEFIAVADGKAPTRAVVPADAEWEDTPEGPLYELAMQTGEEDMDAEALVLGPTRLPRDAMGAPTGQVGRVRIITTPRGAKVYQLIGFSPGVAVQNMRTDRSVELLVWLEGFKPARAMVGPSDWSGDIGARTASLSIVLEPLEEPEPERRR